MTDWTKKPNHFTPRKSAEERGRGEGESDEILARVEREIESDKESYERGLNDGSCDGDEEY